MSPRTFVAFDLETTGLNPQRDSIIEFGAVRFQDDRPRQRFTTYINPGRPLPLRIQQLTGIRPSDLAAAPTIEETVPDILAFLGGRTDAVVGGPTDAVVGGPIDAVVAHSAGFDVSFLRNAGVKIPAPVLDTHELATILLPGQQSYSLSELCRALEIPLHAAHRAGHDAEATADLLLHLLRRVELLPASVLRALSSAGSTTDWDALLLFQDALNDRSDREAGEERSKERSKEIIAQEKRGETAPPPLAPPSSPRVIGEEFLTGAFADDGALAAEFADTAGFEPRVGQLAMAQLVLDALNRGDHKIIEAGTGTGKSLAYLLPAAAWCAANDNRVVIATHTIPLQDQLLDQEIPRVTRILGRAAPTGPGGNDAHAPQLRAMALKGRSRYLCTRRLARWLRQPRPGGTLFGPRLSPLELRLLAKILVWLPHTQTGDLGELPVHDRREQALLAYVASHSDECSPALCFAPVDPDQHDFLGGRFRDFYLEAHRQAESAHLLVVNHALLMADVEAGGQLLPNFDNLIVDEAHRLASAATAQFTRQVDLRLLTSLLDGIDSAISDLAPRFGQNATAELARNLADGCRTLQAALPSFFDALLDYVLRHSGKKGAGRAGSPFPQQLPLDNRIRAQPEWSEIEIQWDELSAQLGHLLSGLTAVALKLDAANRWHEERQPHSHSLLALHRAQTELAALLQVANDVILRPLHTQEQSVAWLELVRQSRTASAKRESPDFVLLRSAPIQVGERLASDLFGALRAVLLTGATLQAGDRFDFLRDQLGCWDAAGTVIESPFDFKRNVLLYMPSDMPTPDRPNYQQAIEEAIQQAALAAAGRTLALFTSHSHLRATADAIRAPLAAAGLTLLQQGEGSRFRNLRDFRANPRAVLLGTSSYWEGIDLPGDQLLCLLIARIPFAVPSDPLYAARSRLYEDAFHEYAVPDAAIRLRQGFGRLVRSASDRGVVVLLDSRLWQRVYGQFFLDALPACTTRQSPNSHLNEAVRNWLGAGR